VLDTNALVSALLFRSGRLSWLRQAWLTMALRPVMAKPTTEELLRVLAYPKFRLTAAEVEAGVAPESAPMPPDTSEQALSEKSTRNTLTAPALTAFKGRRIFMGTRRDSHEQVEFGFYYN
jgi:hypothetical protein